MDSAERAKREENRRSWNAAVTAHNSHRGDIAAFLRAGGSTLFPEERALLGDVRGQHIVHLQCNIGQDAISLALQGAQVIGVDISEVAIATARRLAEATEANAEFVGADVCEWLEIGPRSFDAVLASYGVTCWLPDLGRWACGIARVLKPGGRLVLVEFHPMLSTFDRVWRHAYPYPIGGTERTLEDGVGDYVGESGEGLAPAGFQAGMAAFYNPFPCHLYEWGIGDVVSAIARAGLVVECLEEYPYSNGERTRDGMCLLPGRRLLPPGWVPPLPLMYGLRARAR